MRKIIILFLFPIYLFAQDTVTVDTITDEVILPSIFDFLVNEEIIEITLEAEFDSILASKKFERDLKGKLYFSKKGELQEDISVKIKQRGRYRRKVCDFPPLRLNFGKKQLRKRGLDGKYDKLKLVTHCLNEKGKAKENILREYLAYQLYSLHTKRSFRAHLVKITYKVPNRKKNLAEGYGLLIENEDELARRVNGKIFDTRNCPLDRINPLDYHLSAMFQYMIGNTDWNPGSVHNVKLVQLDTHQIYSPVLYDFDFSGFVNTSYARPNPNIRQKNIRHRVWMCDSTNEEDLKKVVKLFLAKKKTVFKYCQEFDLLPKASRKDIVKYLEDFYQSLEREMYETFLEKEDPRNSKK